MELVRDLNKLLCAPHNASVDTIIMLLENRKTMEPASLNDVPEVTTFKIAKKWGS